jgi:hypothetical protein
LPALPLELGFSLHLVVFSPSSILPLSIASPLHFLLLLVARFLFVLGQEQNRAGLF